MKSLLKSGLALVLAAALFAISSAPASADYYWGRGGGAFAAGVATGIVGLGILGAAAAAQRPYYYGANCRPGPMECQYVTPPCFYGRFGDYICPAPERRCFERPVCY
jgi:hypothetical protein